jgi:hypothetical protein
MRISIRCRNVFATALLLLPATFQAAAQQTAAMAPPPSSGKLEIRLLVTAEPNKVFRPTKGSSGQTELAEPATVVPKGKQIAAVVFFQNCKPSPAGNCNLDVDLKGVDPRGTPFQDRKGAKLWPNRPAPHVGVTQLGAAYMKLQFEPNDPPGTYRIFAVAHDLVGGTEARSEASFEVR